MSEAEHHMRQASERERFEALMVLIDDYAQETWFALSTPILSDVWQKRQNERDEKRTAVVAALAGRAAVAVLDMRAAMEQAGVEWELRDEALCYMNAKLGLANEFGRKPADVPERVSEPTEPRFPVEIRHNDDGSLDEVVSPYFHLEQMDSNHWWMAVYDSADATRRVTVSFHAKGKIKAFAEREGALVPPADMPETT